MNYFSVGDNEMGSRDMIGEDTKALEKTQITHEKTEKNKPVRKAVFPVAGLGTRFLPATKAMPKEMLTVVDRPLIQHVVDEAREAGIEHFIFVTGRNKGVIEDHFDHQAELESVLRTRGKQMQLDLLSDLLPGPGQTSFTRQQEPLGLGHAVWCARELVGDEPFALMLPDVLVKSGNGSSCMKQMMKVHQKTGGNMVAVEEVPHEEVCNYGVVSLGGGAAPLWPICDMVEKPSVEEAPSNLTIMGRYILQPDIFDILDGQASGAGGEIQITDAMTKLLEKQDFHAFQCKGQSFDCGSKLGFLEANVAFALADPDTGPGVKAALLALINDVD